MKAFFCAGSMPWPCLYVQNHLNHDLEGDGHLGSISAHSSFYKTSLIHPKLLEAIRHENP